MKLETTLLGLTLCLTALPGWAVPTNEEVDVVSIKFGMSPEQVMASLKKRTAPRRWRSTK